MDRVVELDREPVFRRGALAEVKVEAERDDDAFSPPPWANGFASGSASPSVRDSNPSIEPQCSKKPLMEKLAQSERL